MQSLGSKIRHGTKWLLAGNVGQQIIQFGFGVILARILVPADFGMLVTVQIFTGLAGLFAGGGMGQALIRAKTVEPHYYSVVFTIQLMICIGIYCLFFLTAPLISYFFNNPLYTDLVRVSALTFLMRPMVNMPKSMLNREMRFKAVSIIGVATILISGASSILMAMNSMGPWSLVLGGIIGSFISMLLFHFVTSIRLNIAFDWPAAKGLAAYGIKITTTEIIPYVISQIGNTLISRLLGPSALGIYNKSDSLSKLPAKTITGSAYQTVFRGLASIQDNLDQSKYVYFRTITLVTVYTLPFYIGLWWLAEPFILQVYGEKWSASIVPLQILAITGLFRCIGNPSGALIAAQDRLGHEIKIQLEAAILTLIGSLIGIRWGINGVATAMVIASLYAALRMSWLANQCIRGNFSDLISALTPALLLCLIMATVLMLGEFLVLSDVKHDNPFYYLVSVSALGAISYAAAFLYLPLAGLETEAGRWKKRLKLS